VYRPTCIATIHLAKKSSGNVLAGRKTNATRGT